MKKKITKTSFVRGVSTELSAREVVELAKAKGLTIREGYVHEIRSVARRKEKRGSAKRVGRPSKEIVKSLVPAEREVEVELMRCVLRLGLRRVSALLSRVESTIGQLV